MGATRTRGPHASRSAGILQQRPTDTGKVVQEPEASKGSQDPIPAPAPVTKGSPGPALRGAQAAVAPPDGGDTSPCPPAQPRDTQAAAQPAPLLGGKDRAGDSSACSTSEHPPGTFCTQRIEQKHGHSAAPTAHTLPRGAVILVPVPPAVPCPLPPRVGQRWHGAGDGWHRCRKQPHGVSPWMKQPRGRGEPRRTPPAPPRGPEATHGTWAGRGSRARRALPCFFQRFCASISTELMNSSTMRVIHCIWAAGVEGRREIRASERLPGSPPAPAGRQAVEEGREGGKGKERKGKEGKGKPGGERRGAGRGAHTTPAAGGGHAPGRRGRAALMVPGKRRLLGGALPL